MGVKTIRRSACCIGGLRWVFETRGWPGVCNWISYALPSTRLCQIAADGWWSTTWIKTQRLVRGWSGDGCTNNSVHPHRPIFQSSCGPGYLENQIVVHASSQDPWLARSFVGTRVTFRPKEPGLEQLMMPSILFCFHKMPFRRSEAKVGERDSREDGERSQSLTSWSLVSLGVQ